MAETTDRGDLLAEIFDDETSKPEPFTDEYVQKEIAWYGTEAYQNEDDTIRIIIQHPKGEVRDYLNRQFLVGQFSVPTLIERKPDPVMSPAAFFDQGKMASPKDLGEPEASKWSLWMSLTPMELQSTYLAVHRCFGEVGTAGLGLGYFALRGAANEDVERVDVYEINPHIIEAFEKRFRDRPEFKKIRIIEGDAREACKDKYYDYFFADCYGTMLPDEVLDDYELFTANNDIQDYHFWGEERLLFHLAHHEELPQNWLKWDERVFLKRFINDEERLSLYEPLDYLSNYEFSRKYLSIAKNHR